MIYIDQIGHLSDSNLDELHDFAQRLWLKREWFQNHPKHPHYDVMGNRLKFRAIKLGANYVDAKQLVKIINEGVSNGSSNTTTTN